MYFYGLQVSTVLEPALGLFRRNCSEYRFPDNKARMDGGLKIVGNQLGTRIVTIPSDPSLDRGKRLLDRI